MKKLLYTASTFSHIRNFHLPYISWFRSQGWQVHVACGGEPEEIPGTERVTALPFQKKMTSPENFRAASILRKLIRAEKYDLISTHTSLAAFFTRLAVKGMSDRPKVVNTVHGYLFDGGTPVLKRSVLTLAERLTAGETDLLLTMNRWDHDFAKAHRLGRSVKNIPGMGVDFSKFDGIAPEKSAALRREWDIPEDAFVLIYPAEFSARKSQRVLIEAMAQLTEKCVLVLPGQGALMDECRTLAASLGLTRRIVFPGQVTEMAPWYAMSDAAVSASRIEGLPFNVMEAMYFALPVVASAVKGHIDLIENGRTGLLYPYGAPSACASAIRGLMDSPTLRQELGGNAKDSVEQYSLDNVFPKMIRVISDTLI